MTFKKSAGIDSCASLAAANRPVEVPSGVLMPMLIIADNKPEVDAYDKDASMAVGDNAPEQPLLTGKDQIGSH